MRQRQGQEQWTGGRGQGAGTGTRTAVGLRRRNSSGRNGYAEKEQTGIEEGRVKVKNGGGGAIFKQ